MFTNGTLEIVIAFLVLCFVGYVVEPARTPAVVITPGTPASAPVGPRLTDFWNFGAHH